MDRPMDEARFPNDKGIIVPAFDKSLLAPIQFLPYVPATQSEPASLQERTEVLQLIISDVQALLALPHHRFWTHVVHDETLRAFLDSYLRFAPRPHDAPEASAPLRAAEQQLARDVFMVFVRLSTNKEAPSVFLSASKFADVIYNSGMLDMTAILDLCSIYGATNGPLLAKMVSNVFKMQPKYNTALETAATHMGTTLGRIAVGGLSLGELAGLLLDVGNTLRILFTLFPPAAQAFLEKHFLLTLARFYDQTASTHAAALRVNGAQGQGDSAESARLRLALYFLLQACDSLVDTAFSVRHADDARTAEQLLFWLTELLDVPLFLRDYCGCFPLAPRVQALKRHASVDAVCADHIIQCVTSLDGVYSAVKAASAVVLPATAGPAVAVAAASATVAAAKGTAKTAPAASAAGKASDVSAERAEKISMVQSMLPDLGAGFVSVCLDAYGDNVERTLNHIFEDSLPTHIKELPRDLALESSAPAPAAAAAAVTTAFTPPTSISLPPPVFAPAPAPAPAAAAVPPRSLFSETPMVSIGRGRGYTDHMRILDDKSFVTAMKSFYAEYEDEYDDTYDGLAAPAEAEEEDLLVPNPNHINRLLDDDEDDESEENENGAGAPLPAAAVAAVPRTQAPMVVSHRNGGRGGGAGGAGRGGTRSGPAGSNIFAQEERERDQVRVAGRDRGGGHSGGGGRGGGLGGHGGGEHSGGGGGRGGHGGGEHAGGGGGHGGGGRGGKGGSGAGGSGQHAPAASTPAPAPAAAAEPEPRRVIDSRREQQHKDRNKAHVANHNRKQGADWKRSRAAGAFPPQPPSS